MSSAYGLTRALYSAAILLGAFLLFLVEPMAAKQLLPALGGSSAVWITCLVFFQVVLLIGYSYAHWLGRLRPTQSASIHIAMLLLAVCALALIGSPDLSSAASHPWTAIFRALSQSIGLPFLLLASTSPLLQIWIARQQSGDIPWRLFALSNAGSLLALLLYPAWIEPHFALSQQHKMWAIGFALYAMLCIVLAWCARTIQAPRISEAIEDTSHQSTSLHTKLLWFLLPAGASTQLCAVTSHLSQNIAAIPLLWVLPLAIYLLSFIVAFEAPRLYRPWLIVRLLVVMLASLAYMLSKTDVTIPILLSVIFFLAELFLACYFCHAQTHALRPDNPSEATLLYLLIAAGGAAGTIFIGIICPLVFDANYDVALSFLVTAALALAVTWPQGWPPRLLWSVGTALLLALVIMLHIVFARGTLVEERNFYSALRVRQSLYPPQAHTVRTLLNGTIEHGTQWMSEDFRHTPTTYYAQDSGIGLAMRFCCNNQPRRIGVVGLGAGTLAAYGQKGDTIRFYEINAAVRPIAENLFTYLRDSQAQISFAEGDARLSLSHEQAQNFDVLAIDAFSGDAIPLHLLTTQAMQMYRRQLAPGGILAFHVSNQYLDLTPEIGELAASAGMDARVFDTPSNAARGEYRATWVLVTDRSAFFAQPEVFLRARKIQHKSGLYPWTDDRSSLLPVLQWRLIKQP